MRFLSVYQAAERTVPPTAEEIARMGNLSKKAKERGPAGYGRLYADCARCAGPSFQWKDGDYRRPFQRVQRGVAGFALLQVDSKEQALEHVKHFLDVVGGDECELRQLYD